MKNPVNISLEVRYSYQYSFAQIAHTLAVSANSATLIWVRDTARAGSAWKNQCGRQSWVESYDEKELQDQVMQIEMDLCAVLRIARAGHICVSAPLLLMQGIMGGNGQNVNLFHSRIGHKSPLA